LERQLLAGSKARNSIKNLHDRQADGNLIHRTYFHYFLQDTNNMNAHGNRNKTFKHTRIVRNLLRDNLASSERVLAKPSRMFERLADCIHYEGMNYYDLEGVVFSGRGKNRKSSPVLLPERFGDWRYDEFKREVLVPLDVDNIGDAVVEFTANNTFRKQDSDRQTATYRKEHEPQIPELGEHYLN
jgi:hypothetical protein